jgi:hypothetical protein
MPRGKVRPYDTVAALTAVRREIGVSACTLLAGSNQAWFHFPPFHSLVAASHSPTASPLQLASIR